MSNRALRVALAAVAGAAALWLIPATAAGEPPAPGAYQENDGLGFRNILPPGQDGLADTNEIFAFIFGGGPPEHWVDQLDEYDELLQAAPGISPTGVDAMFKDASFGVAPGDVDVEYTPDCEETTPPAPGSEHCDDVTIVRDDSYGVPHIYGADRAAAMFAAGYVGAEDRLFFMDVERHLGRAELSSFLGGSNISSDRGIWRSAPYREAELQAQFDDLDDIYGADGAQVQADVENYVDGVNQYIGEGRAGTAPLPGEYTLALEDPDGGPDPWQTTDIVATALLVAGQFGKGGGNEVGSALVLEEAVERFGAEEGRSAWSDFRSREDAEAPTTVHETVFPYGAPPAEPEGVALPDPGTVTVEPITAGQPAPKHEGAGRPLFKDLFELDGASNALLVSAAESASGQPLAVMGPQTGYFSPQFLTEMDIHAPGGPEGPPIDARGVGFAGISLYVLIGRGNGYAWSATSAGQDIADTYAVELCDPDNPGDPGEITDDGYRYDGVCEEFDVLERVNSWSPNAADPTPAGSETLRALRTKLGIVSHRGEVEGTPVAFTILRATYMHEADSAIGFSHFNEPQEMESAAEFQDVASSIDLTFNWFYASDEEIAYFNSGANPVRPAHVDPSLPVEGAPENTWQGFDPDALTFNRAPAAEHPQAIDQDYLTSWNNKQAVGFSAADDTYSYGSVHRVDSLNERIEAGIAGAETMSREELVDAMEDAATVDLRGSQVLPWAIKAVRKAPAKAKPKAVRKALKTLKTWSKAGAHRLDADEDGRYEDRKAIKIMDAWWPRLVQAQFKPALGEGLYAQIQTMMGLDNSPGANGSAYISGWYGYVEKDLRSVLGAEPADPFSREYCASGKPRRCGEALARSLTRALKNRSNEALYPGHPTTACSALATSPDAQWCHDSIRARATGAITVPPIDWQNRPTFQQVVEVQGPPAP